MARDAAGRGLRVTLLAQGDLGGDLGAGLLAEGLYMLRPSPDPAEAGVLSRVYPHLWSGAPTPERRWWRRPRQQATPHAAIAPQRFAILSARDAAERGARVITSLPNPQITPQGGAWHITAKGYHITARAMVAPSAPGTTHAPANRLMAIAILASADAGDTPGDALFSLRLSPDCRAVGLPGGAPRPKGALWFADKIRQPASALGAALPHVDPDAPAPLIIAPPVPASRARAQAEAAVAELSPFVRMIGKAWTRYAPLPGGDFCVADASGLLTDMARRHPARPRNQIRRLFAAYGTEAETILSAPAGPDFGGGLTGAEVAHLAEKEWAATADDVLWRRSLLGLTATQAQVGALRRHMGADRPCSG
ncbi:MAG: glycerol-3-phosphate dehydrogenase C-terminal domain-containing protein [Pseudomonadota bacterium]